MGGQCMGVVGKEEWLGSWGTIQVHMSGVCGGAVGGSGGFGLGSDGKGGRRHTEGDGLNGLCS